MSTQVLGPDEARAATYDAAAAEPDKTLLSTGAVVDGSGNEILPPDPSRVQRYAAAPAQVDKHLQPDGSVTTASSGSGGGGRGDENVEIYTLTLGEDNPALANPATIVLTKVGRRVELQSFFLYIPARPVTGETLVIDTLPNHLLPSAQAIILISAASGAVPLVIDTDGTVTARASMGNATVSRSYAGQYTFWYTE